MAPMHFIPPLGTDPSPWLSPQKEGLVRALRENHNLLLTCHSDGFLAAVPPLCPRAAVDI